MHELTESAVEDGPPKFRSPPPKPPRRRHSDQLSTSSGKFLSMKKPMESSKVLKENISYMKINSKSGCGSLPANWTADFQTEDIHVHIKPNLNTSSKFVQTLSKNLSFPNQTFDECASHFYENSTCRRKSSTCFIHTKDNRLLLTQDPEVNFNSSETILKRFSRNSESVSCESECSFCRRNIKNLCIHSIIRKKCHRRHYSDPLMFHSHHSQNSSSVKKNNRLSLTDDVYCGYKHTDCKSSVIAKENHYLCEEINCWKDMYNKVWEQLCSVQASLENFGNSSSGCPSPLSVSDLLSQLYHTQKAKDQAMEERLKLAIEERNTVASEFEEMLQVIARNLEGNDTVCLDISEKDKDITNLLQEIEKTHNPSDLLQKQRVLLSYLYQYKKAKQDHLSHQLKLSLVERDNALEKIKKLEEEVKYTKLCNDIFHFDTKHWEASLLDILCQVVEQRDANLRKNDSLNELKHYKGYRAPRLQKSPSDLQTSDSYKKLDRKLSPCSSDSNTVFKCFQSSPVDQSKNLQLSPDKLQDEIRVLKEEIFVLTKAFEDEVKRREYAEDKCMKLERLVQVLRKKINGQNVGVPL